MLVGYLVLTTTITTTTSLIMMTIIVVVTWSDRGDDDDKPMSKKALKKQQKEAEKAAKKQQQQEQTAAAADAAGGDAADCAAGCYGVMPMIQSKEKIDRTIVRIGDLTGSRAGEKVWVRGRLHTSRAVGQQMLLIRMIMCW